MANRVGFAQVERNHMSGEVEGKVYAQLPVNQTTMGTVIENGRFAKYDAANGAVNLSGAGEWCMIYNEKKIYDDNKVGHKYFAMEAANYVDKVITPRLIAVEIGDIFTTNAIHDSVMAIATISALTEKSTATFTVAAGNTLYIGTDGYLTTTKPDSYSGPEFEVIKVYTLADEQDAAKVVRVK